MNKPGANTSQGATARWHRFTIGLGILVGCLASSAAAVPLAFVSAALTDYGSGTLTQYTDSGTTVAAQNTLGHTISCPGPMLWACVGPSYAEGIFSNSSGLVRTVAFAEGNYATAAYASGKDFFTLSGGAPGAMYDITARITLRGSLQADAVQSGAPNGISDATISDLFQVGIENQFGNFILGAGVPVSYVDAARSASERADCFASGCATAAKSIRVVLSFPFQVAADVEFYVAQGLLVGAERNGTANFWDTATLSFLLPEGTSISSQGGFFQAASTGQPVPEPSTLALLCASIAGWLAVRRRRSGAKLARPSGAMAIIRRVFCAGVG